MNKIMKAGVIVGIVGGLTEAWFAIGKGYSIGLLTACENDYTPSDLLEDLSKNNDFMSKIMTKVAKYEKERCLKNIIQKKYLKRWSPNQGSFFYF